MAHLDGKSSSGAAGARGLGGATLRLARLLALGAALGAGAGACSSKSRTSPPPGRADLAMEPRDLALPVDDGGVYHFDGGTCTAPFSGACCDAQGHESGMPMCVGGGWTCAPGSSLCLCGQQPETFSCTDFCGSDEFSSPVCVDGSWQCPGAVPVHTDSCPPGTCWGLPVECCDAQGTPIGIECQDGHWSCPGTWCYQLDGGVPPTPGVRPKVGAR